MAKIIINISDDVYYRCKNERVGLLPFDVPEVCYAIQNGTVLPKGHGRLIDADALKEKMLGTQRYFHIKYDIDEAPTIIEADLEEVKKTRKRND